VKPLRPLARKINAEIDRLFPADIEILAEPGRYLVATAATAIARVIGKAVRDGKTCYYIDDSVYHTYSGIVFDHCQYRLKCLQDAARRNCRRSLARRATAWTSSRSPRSCRSWRSTTWSTPKTSARTATPRRRGSTASPPAQVVHVNE
jgi:hypothetical protein